MLEPEKQPVIQNVEINQISTSDTGELSDYIHCECKFCRKIVGLYPSFRKMCERLSGGEFYCSFCLRNSFNGKLNRNVLILSFRGIIGYYYYEKYINCNNRQMCISEIEGYIESHVKTGLQNPLFSYDPETMLWFIDFNHVGRSSKKIKINEIMKTIANILVCFNLQINMPALKTQKLYQKYKMAIMKFYSNRFRPINRPHLIPTLSGCGIAETKKYNVDDTRDFLLP